MNTLIAWTKQPTTVTGLATLAGTASALLTHQLNLMTATPLLVGALLSIVIPDNGGAQVAIQNLVADAVKAEQLIVKPHGDLTVTPALSEPTRAVSPRA